MLGRVRASPLSSLEMLEMERPSSKIIKHDSLSIYEATLLKLKQGSYCSASVSVDDSARMDAQSIMAIDTPGIMETPTNADSSSGDSSPESSSNLQSTCSSKQHEGKNMSILYLFSRYNSSSRKQCLSDSSSALPSCSSS